MDYPCVEHLARFIYRAQAKCQLNLGLGGYSKITLPESKVSVPIPHNTLYTT